MKKIFFQSSMPRAGSTLFQNIIGQNPEFYVTPTSGLIDLILGARIGYNQSKESKAGDKELWKRGFYAFCKSGLKGYLNDVTDKPYILDKSRAWGSYYGLVSSIVSKPKVIVVIRDLRAVFSSMEKKFRLNPDYDDGLLDNRTLQNTTTLKRVETWAKSHPVGYAVEKLEQTFLDRTADNFLFVRYEDMCTHPEPVFSSVYEYLELPYFEHNFEVIPQITYEDDTIHGIYGDHTIRNTLQMFPNDWNEILGEEISNLIYNNFKWYFNIFGYQQYPSMPTTHSNIQSLTSNPNTPYSIWKNNNNV